MIEENIRTMAENIARAHGCTAEIDWQSAVSAVINDEAATQAAIAVAQKLFGTEAVNPDMTPFMSSEDFSVYQEKIPGCMLRVGVRDEAHQATVHSTAFDFNDAVLPAAAQLLARIAASRLETLAQK